jgi:hypothetical protein
MEDKNYLDESFKYRLEILSKEIDLTNSAIDRIDGITQAVKNWAIVIWAGSVSLFLGSVELRKFLILTAILPFMFWISDARWRNLQKRSVVRQRKISEFVNSDKFVESFKTKNFKNFYLLDPVGRTHWKEDDFRKAISMRKTFFYKEIIWFYGGLMLLSLLLGSFFLFFPGLIP